MAHKSVLLHESIQGLNLHDGSVFVDATLNGGGHSRLVADTFHTKVKIIGIDADSDAINRASKFLEDAKPILVEENFRNIDKVLEGVGIKSVDAILFDLGLSSNQIEKSGRGFSFQTHEPLLMTLKKSPQPDDITAYEVLNHWEEESIADIIFAYGEERFARRIAKAIVDYRVDKSIKTTDELANIVTHATPMWYRFKKIHPATRTFQAIRIAVNDELRALTESLTKSFELLAPNGRIAIISFHSLEDRIVKRYFRKLADEEKAILVTKKPIVPSENEQRENPRSRSAKLRILQKI